MIVLIEIVLLKTAIHQLIYQHKKKPM